MVPYYHPSSVGLAERYVQLIIKLLRAEIQKHEDGIFIWDEFLPSIIEAANTRFIRIYGYSPAELLLGFNPIYHRGMIDLESEIRQESIVSQEPNMVDESMSVEEANYEVRLARLDEIRNIATKNRLMHQERVAESSDKHGKIIYKNGDLVLLRRLAQDKQKSHKLEPRWEGPYIIDKKNDHEKSLVLRNIHSDDNKGKYHTNDVKPFVERREHVPDEESWQSIMARNEKARTDTRNRQAMREQARKHMIEEFLKIGRPITDDDIEDAIKGRESNLFKNVPQKYESGFPEETDWEYWRHRAVNL